MAAFVPSAKGGILEKDVRDASLAIAKKLRVFHKRMHFGPGAARGWPDDLFMLPHGHHWWVEFKRPGGKATELQNRMHNQMRMYGADVSVIDNAFDFDIELRKRLARKYVTFAHPQE